MKSAMICSQSDLVIAAVRDAMRLADVQLSVIDERLPLPRADLLVLDPAVAAETLARLSSLAPAGSDLAEDLAPGSADSISDVTANSAAAGALAALPILFVSASDTLDARLTAVRHGGSAFFALPLDPAWFGETVRELLRTPHERPYRALIVDDDRAMLGLFSHHLKAAGFDVHALNDPRAAYADALLFTPDVVFLDIAMPGINGLEWLTLLRQQPGFTSTQVVLVSHEHSLGAQLEAMSAGAQNYLVKPVQGRDLVQTALNNAARARALRDAAARDPLTGLYNPGHMHELVAREFARHQRTAAVFSIMLVNVSNFGGITRTHGALAGDMALKQVAAQLLQKIRRCDCAGRFGYSQFMLLLQDTNKHGARKLADKLLASPVALAHNGDHIAVRLSCGIADSEQRKHAGSTLSAAEDALRDASRSERAVAVA